MQRIVASTSTTDLDLQRELRRTREALREDLREDIEFEIASRMRQQSPRQLSPPVIHEEPVIIQEEPRIEQPVQRIVASTSTTDLDLQRELRRTRNALRQDLREDVEFEIASRMRQPMLSSNSDGMIPVVTLSFTPEMLGQPRNSFARSDYKPRFQLKNARPQLLSKPTEASRGWRMAFSPDWQADRRTSRDEWLHSRSKFIGRTAAMHQPWMAEETVHRPALREATRTQAASQATTSPRGERQEDGSTRSDAASSSPRQAHVGSIAFRTPAQTSPRRPRTTGFMGPRPRSRDRETELGYRSSFAWTQHRFPGEHIRHECGSAPSEGVSEGGSASVC